MIPGGGFGTHSSSASGSGAALGAVVGTSRPRSSGSAPRVSRPSAPPVYSSGSVQSTRPTVSNAAQAAAQYQSRLNAYNTARNTFLAGLGKVKSQADSAYKTGISGANAGYGKGAKGLKSNYDTTKKSLASQRTQDIQGMGNDFANRSITANSGIYQQAMKDYESQYGSRVAGAGNSYNAALKGLAGQRNQALSSAAARRSATLAKTKSQQAAYDKAHPKPGK